LAPEPQREVEGANKKQMGIYMMREVVRTDPVTQQDVMVE